MSSYAEPVTLEGHTVSLSPLQPEHAHAMFAALDNDEEVWRYLPTEIPATVGEMREWMDAAFDDNKHGTRLQFAVMENASGRLIGSTSYCNISEANRGLEIGYTWYNRSFWRTAVNTECKYLLMRRAFEDLGCIRVQLRTDSRNARSRAAIERLGCSLEGIIREDRIIKGGYHRSSAQYSMLAAEWRARKAWFEERLAIAV
jgi:RimJ/RimL family protein N-acetyltransferase